MAIANSAIYFDLFARDRTASKTFRDVGMAAERSESRLSKFGRTFATVFKTGAVAAAGLATAGIAAGVKTTAGLEQAQISFETLLGSGKEARRFLEQLRDFAKTTPFELPGLIDLSRQLVGVGVDAKDVIGVLRDWGDASAALGLSQEQFGRAMLAVIQMMAKGKIQGEELLQLVEAGIPVWGLLEKATGKSAKQLQELASKGELTSDKILPALQRQLRKDYAGSMIKQSRTLSGMWSNLMDTLNMGMAGTLEPLVPLMKDTLSGAIRVAGEAFEALPGVIQTVRPYISGFVGFIKDTAVPGLFEFGRTFVDRFIPVGRIKRAFQDVKQFVVDFLAGFTGANVPSASDMMMHVFDPSEATKLGMQFRDLLSGGIDDAIKNLDWNELGRKVGSALGSAIEFSLDLGEKIAHKLGEIAGQIDWVEVGKGVGGRAIGFGIGFVNGLGEELFDPQFWKDHFWDVVAAVVGFGAVGKIAGGLAKVASKVPVLRAFTPMLDKVNKLTGPFQKVLSGVFKVAGKMALGLARPFLDGFRRVFPEAGKKLGEWVRTFGPRITSAGKSVWNKAKEMVRGIGRAIRGAKNAVLSALGELVGRIVKRFGNAGKWLWNAGRNIISGLIGGLRSKLGELEGWIHSIARKVRNAFPFSPAKEGPLRRYPLDKAGENMAKQLAAGMKKGQPLVASAAAGLASMPLAGPSTTGLGTVPLGGSAARPVVVELRISGGGNSGLERMFLSWLQNAIRSNPGVRLVTQ